MDTNIIIPSIVAVCVFCVGICMHLKVIIVSVRDKEMTWKIDVSNSCLLIVHHGHRVLMNVMTYVIPNLQTYTSKWLCYTSKIFTYYGSLYVVGHSLVVSILKYVIIIHWQKARNIGHNKIVQIFFWVNLLHPLAMIFLHSIIWPEFIWRYDGFASVDRCLGHSRNSPGPNSNGTEIKLHTIYQGFDKPGPHDDNFTYSLYLLRVGISWIQVVVIYLIIWNAMEILVYCRLFSFMRR